MVVVGDEQGSPYVVQVGLELAEIPHCQLGSQACTTMPAVSIIGGGVVLFYHFSFKKNISLGRDRSRTPWCAIFAAFI